MSVLKNSMKRQFQCQFQRRAKQATLSAKNVEHNVYSQELRDRQALTEASFYIPQSDNSNTAYTLLQELVLQTTHLITLVGFGFI